MWNEEEDKPDPSIPKGLAQSQLDISASIVQLLTPPLCVPGLSYPTGLGWTASSSFKRLTFSQGKDAHFLPLELLRIMVFT